MKTMKIVAIATAITIALIALCGIATATAEDRGEFYPRLAVVIAWENVGENLTRVTCTDKDGNLWDLFTDEGDLKIGDVVNLMMWRVDENPEHDEVTEYYYEGHCTLAEMLHWMVD